MEKQYKTRHVLNENATGFSKVSTTLENEHEIITLTLLDFKYIAEDKVTVNFARTTEFKPTGKKTIEKDSYNVYDILRFEKYEVNEEGEEIEGGEIEVLTEEDLQATRWNAALFSILSPELIKGMKNKSNLD